jgi:hypothetical protein
LQALVQPDQKVDGAHLGAVDRVEKLLEGGRCRLGHQVRRQLFLQALVIDEGIVLGAGLQEEVERVVHRHLGDQIDGDLELGGRLREHQATEVIGKRILLPVDEVAQRLDPHRIRQDGRAAMRSRAQPDDLRRQIDPAVIAVMRDVTESDVDGHGVTLL